MAGPIARLPAVRAVRRQHKEPADMRLVRAFVAAALVVLTITPAAVLAQGLEMTTDFPAVVADPGATVRFPVTVTTDTPERVDLTVVEQPEGWDDQPAWRRVHDQRRLHGPNPEVAGEISATFTAEVTVPEDVRPGPTRS